MDVYPPSEDSELLKKHIKTYAKGNVLDMGTGSGILAAEAAKYAKSVIALDLNEKAVAQAKARVNADNVLFYQSNLFQLFELDKIKRDFDLIIFNPPYLPSDDHYPNIALDGGKEGYEIVEEFLRKSKYYLKPTGVMLILISSLTKKSKVESIMESIGYKHKLIDQEKHAFESLYVYEVKM